MGLRMTLWARSLLLIETLDLQPSSQYILESVMPRYFCLAEMYLCQVRHLSWCSPRYLTSSAWGRSFCSS
jgi:hypothetical protein